MEVEYSSTSNEEKIYVTVDLYEDVELNIGNVKVGCHVKYSDSRLECANSAKVEAIRLLKLALEELEG